MRVMSPQRNLLIARSKTQAKPQPSPSPFILPTPDVGSYCRSPERKFHLPENVLVAVVRWMRTQELSARGKTADTHQGDRDVTVDMASPRKALFRKAYTRGRACWRGIQSCRILNRAGQLVRGIYSHGFKSVILAAGKTMRTFRSQYNRRSSMAFWTNWKEDSRQDEGYAGSGYA